MAGHEFGCIGTFLKTIPKANPTLAFDVYFEMSLQKWLGLGETSDPSQS